MRFYNENDYLDWLESQYTEDEIAEREHWEALQYERHLEALQADDE